MTSSRSQPSQGAPLVGDGVEKAEAVAALSRVLNSAEFIRSRSSREFLAYVATETLGGRGDRLHGRTIARYALGLGADFDGARNSIARVRATRVRKALVAYYADDGKHDRVRISIPPGTYVPTFVRASDLCRDVARASTTAMSSIAVIQLDPRGQTSGPSGLLAHELTAELQRIPDLTVVLASRREPSPATELAHELNVRFVLVCAVSETARVAEARLQLTDAHQAQLLWSKVEQVDSALSRDVARQWAVEAVASIGDYAGLILRRLQGADEKPRGPDGAARLAFYRHVTEGSIESMLIARAALERALEAGTPESDLRAMLAFILAVLDLNGPPGVVEQVDRQRAVDEARHVLRQDPSTVLAHLALAILALSDQDFERAREGALLAADLSPRHPSHLFTAGGILAAAGEWRIGAELMRRSFDLNPFHPAYQHANLAVERLLARDLPGALAEASIVDEGAGVWGPFCRALALNGMGYPEEAHLQMKAALEFEPHLTEDPTPLFSGILIDADQRANLVELLRPFRDRSEGAMPGDGQAKADR